MYSYIYIIIYACDTCDASIYMHLATYNMYVAMSSRIPYMMHHMCRVSCVCGEMHIDRCITCNYLQMHHMGLMLCDVSMYAMYLCVCVCDKYHVSIMCLRYILLYAGTHIRIQYIRYDTCVSCVQRIYCMRLQKPCRSVMCLMTYTIRRVMYLSCISRIYCMRLHKPCRIVCWISAARVHI